MWLCFLVVLCTLVCSSIPEDQSSTALAVAQKPEISVVGGATWHGRPQEAGLSTWWLNSPASLHACCSLPGEQAAFLPFILGWGLVAGGAGAGCIHALTCSV